MGVLFRLFSYTHDVEERTWRFRRGEEFIYHRCWRHSWALKPSSGRWKWRYGSCHRKEGKTRASKKSNASRCDKAEENFPTERRYLPLFRRQRRCHCKQQGGDEGIGYHGSSFKRMRGSLA